MAIDDLVAIIPPPSGLLEIGGDDDWREVQNSLKLDLPQDLRDFGMRYGTGRFCNGLIQVFNPFSPEYQRIIEWECQTQRMVEEDFGKQPYAVYPERPGLFPWGRDENGHKMFWLIEGESAKWPILLESRDVEYEQWDLSMTTFLGKALNNEVKCLLWQRPFSRKKLTFEPGPVS